MKLRVLGCAGAEFPGFHPPAFLVDDSLLLDAGTIGAVLTKEEQLGISHIFVTHAHLDHIRGIPPLADNIILEQLKHQVFVLGCGKTIAALRDHLMNNIIWPDFSCLPSKKEAVIAYMELEPGRTFTVDGHEITPFPVAHSIPAVGYVVRREGKGILYTGDTGPTKEIWEHAAGLSAIIVEVSFPNALEDMARLTGHLTPRLLAEELGKLKALPPRILITHPKPQYYDSIRRELHAINIPRIELLKDGNTYTF